MIYYRKSSINDCIELGPKLRKADLEEVKASSNMSGTDALLHGLSSSDECYTMLDTKTGEPIGMFGIVFFKATPSKSPWMLATDKLTELHNSKVFLKECTVWLDYHNDGYCLFNEVDARNTVALQWLRWCGFQIINAIERNNALFYEFVRVR